MSSTHLRRGSGRSRRVIAPVLALLTAMALFVASPVSAGAADITSAGPLEKITTSPDLNCAINHTGDSHGAFYGETACGTFVTDGTTWYGPADVPAGPDAGSDPNSVAWTPVSQNTSGAGTTAAPYTIVTKVTGGPFTVTQTDSYVVGQEVFRTDVQVASSSSVTATVYRAGDCYLQGSDTGLGSLQPGGAATCNADPGSVDPNRILQFYPLTANSNHMVAHYSDIWTAVTSMQPFPNTIRDGADGAFDNGAGLSWTRAVSPAAPATFSSFIVFSPLGVQPVTVTKSANVSTVAPGGEVAYTITLTNPSPDPVAISAITDHLPAGFTYVAGTTTGATTTDPAVSGQDLTWTSAFSVPGRTEGGPGTLSLTFSVTASSVPGTYTNSANGVASDLASVVIGAVDTAPVTVQGDEVTTTTTAPTTTTTRATRGIQAATPIAAAPTYTG